MKRVKELFHDLFSQSMKWEYRGLQGGYKGLQGVTWGYKGLQGVTEGYKGLQWVKGVTKDYRNVFLTRSFPDTFSWSILHKSKKRQPNPFRKIVIFRLSYNSCFYSL